MALRQLEIIQQMQNLKQNLQTLNDKAQSFVTRHADLERRTADAVMNVRSMNEADAVKQAEIDKEAEAIEADRAALDEEEEQNKNERMNLQAQIDQLDTELKDINERAEAAHDAPEQKRRSDFMETRAEILHSTNKATYQADEIRSVLVSGGKLATPTGVDGIHDQMGPHYSSILDLVTVVNCVGMGSNKVAYMVDPAAADDQTEGSAATAKEPTFDFVTIQPTSIAVQAAISKQARKQTPLLYEAKVTAAALTSLKKAAVEKIVAALGTSTLTQAVTVTGVDQKTLRTIALNYGGTEGVAGEAVLFLNKANLIAFGDVRGTNEKKAVYEITPDAANPNMGTIKDGGLTVRYCLVSKLANTAMYYGNPANFELDLFSDYEIVVSQDFAITSLMDTIVGDVELGGAVVVKDGFEKITIGAGA